MQFGSVADPSPLLTCEQAVEVFLTQHKVHIVASTDVQRFGEWCDEEVLSEHCQFHWVTEGQCGLRCVDLNLQTTLCAGDLILFFQPHRHQLSWRPDPDTRIEAVTAAPAVTRLVCGQARPVHPLTPALAALLPRYVIVRVADMGPGIVHLAHAMTGFAGDHGERAGVVRQQLAQAMLALVVYACGQHRITLSALAHAPQDPRLTRVLDALHADPGRHWNLQDMARRAGLSRSAFAQLFALQVGVPPMQYLSQWRASEAKRLLGNRRMSVASVAEQLGYRSEAAFRRFFKRVTGVGPGEIRRRAIAA